MKLAPNILGLATDINVESLLNLTNQKRAEDGLGPLNLDSQLSQAAAGKAQDMFSKDYWAHNSPDGATPWVFIKGAGYNYLYAGENLAKNFSNSEGVVIAWMASPSHKANMVKPEYQDVGFAVVNGRLGGEETTLVVQMFGAKQRSGIAVKPPSSPTSAPTISPTKMALAPTPVVEITPMAQEKVATAFARTNLPPIILASAKNSPNFNFFSLTKNAALIFTGFLMLLLVLDAVLIWRRKTIRLAGHNFAHLSFLMAVAVVIWLTQQGGIR